MKLLCKGETTNVSMMKGMYQNGDSTAPVAINLMPVSIAPNGAPNDGFENKRSATNGFLTMVQMIKGMLMNK